MNSPLPLLQEHLTEAEGEGKDVELTQVFTKWVIDYILELENTANEK
jgi:hypothetical protein